MFFEIKSLKKFLIIIPIITGTVTTKAIFNAITVIVISFDILICKKFADVKTKNGTDIILIKLVIAVKDIDRATSPSANLVKTFEVTPPGAAAMIINPRASSFGNLSTKINIYATIGRRINWQINPSIKSLGVLITLKKSFNVSPRPKPNIIIARAIGANLVTISIFKN